MYTCSCVHMYVYMNVCFYEYVHGYCFYVNFSQCVEERGALVNWYFCVYNCKRLTYVHLYTLYTYTECPLWHCCVTRQKGVTYAKYDKLYFCLMFNTQRINNGKMSNFTMTATIRYQQCFRIVCVRFLVCMCVRVCVFTCVCVCAYLCELKSVHWDMFHLENALVCTQRWQQLEHKIRQYFPCIIDANKWLDVCACVSLWKILKISPRTCDTHFAYLLTHIRTHICHTISNK